MNWVKLTNVASELEAELLVERLKSANVIAVSRGNDIVGLFGPGFQGRTARGVDILVASEHETMARELLAEFLDEDDDMTDEPDSDREN
jgi:hypothetical protein